MYRPFLVHKRFCRILALWPYEGSMSFRSFDMYYRYIVFVMDMIVIKFYVHILFDYHLVTGAKHEIILGNEILSFACFITLCLALLVMGFTNRNKMADVLESCENADLELTEVGVQQDLQKTDAFQAIQIAIAFTLWTFTLFYDSDHMKIAKLSVIAILFARLQVLFVPSLLTGIAHLLKTRFASINDQLRLLRQEMPTKSTSHTLSKLKKLIKVHIHLSGIVKRVNSTFAVQTLLYFAFSVARSGLLLLNILQSVRSTGDVDHAELKRNLIYLLGTVVQNVILTGICQAASYEANLTVHLVHRLHQADSPLSIMQEIEMFSLGMVNNYVEFSAAGILTLNQALITKICISITTYLVISLQIINVKT